MPKIDFSNKIKELEEQRVELEGQLGVLAGPTEGANTERKAEIRSQLSVLHFQIVALQKAELAQDSVIELFGKVPTVDEVLARVNEFSDDTLKKGWGLFQGFKDQVLKPFNAEGIDEKKMHHFQAIISLLKAGQKASALKEIRVLESENCLVKGSDAQLEGTINAVENLVDAGHEDAALAVLVKLYN